MAEDTPPPRSPNTLRSEFADDSEMVEIVEMFVREMPDRVAALETSYRSGEIEGLRRLAHQLKGASGGFGFPTVGAAAGRLETSLHALVHGAGGGNLEAIRGELDRLIELCRSVTFR